MGNSYEIGWKGAWNNNKLNTTLALFQTEKHNQPTDTWLGKDLATGNIRPWVRGDRAIYTPVRNAVIPPMQIFRRPPVIYTNTPP